MLRRGNKAPPVAYHAMHGFGAMLEEDDYRRTNAEDMEFLTTVSTDRNAKAPERAAACFSLGRLHWCAGRREEAIKAYKRAMKLTMTPAERAVLILGRLGPMTTSGEAFDEETRNCRNNLTRLGAIHNDENEPLTTASDSGKDPDSRSVS